MSKFLASYLLYTGIGAFVALAWPSLVVLGMFLLIIPGLVLALMPPAFMYGVIFTAGWWIARSFFGDGPLPIMAGAAVLALVVTSVTKPTRAVDLASYRASLLPDLKPSAPIELTGDVRFNFQNPRTNKSKTPGPYVAGKDGYECNAYCMAALFTPGVTSVTIDKSGLDDLGKPSIEARTYRLVRRPDCQSNVEVNLSSMQAPLRGKETVGITHFEDGKVLVDEWAMKLASEYCMVMEPAIRAHTFTITERQGSGQYRRKKWSFGPGTISTQTVEIHHGNSLVYRDHQSSLNTLSKILFIEGTGGIENFSFGWGRATIHSKRGYDSVTLQKILGDATNLAGKPVAGSGRAKNAAVNLPAYRSQIEAALADPSLTEKSPGFQLMEGYFKAVGENASEQDVQVLSRLVADPRITRFEGAWHLKLPVERMKPIYDAYARRIIEEGAPLSFQKSLMQNTVTKMGPESFKLIGADQRTLLNNPASRLAVPEMVTALGYGAPRNARILFQMLKQHAGAIANIDRMRANREIKGYGLQDQRDANMTMLGAVQQGLCLIAPQDPELAKDLEEFLASGVMPAYLVEGHNRTDWDVLLVRMGKPLSSVEQPARLSGSIESHRQRVQQRVAKWKPQDCQ